MHSVILIVDDDPDVVEICRRYLFDRDYAVLWAGSGKEALEVLSRHRVDVILLDVMLPDISGFELVERTREASDADIVFLTARDAPEDRVRGLHLGSEYLTKPFELEELSLRLAMLEQRKTRRKRFKISLPHLELDCVRRRALIDGKPVLLTESEFRLIERLAETPDVPVSYEELSELLWPGLPLRTHNLMTHVSSIRRKLRAEENPHIRILGERTVGYRLNCGEEPASRGRQ